MAPALGVVVHEARQAAVQVPPLERVGRLVRPRREQRMGEAHALALDLEHAGLEGGAQRLLTPGRGHDQRERRPRQRGDRGQRRTRRPRQRREPLADHLAQPRGHRRQVRPAASLGVRARQLEREEGVAARHLVDAPQPRAGERHSRAARAASSAARPGSADRAGGAPRARRHRAAAVSRHRGAGPAAGPRARPGPGATRRRARRPSSCQATGHHRSRRAPGSAQTSARSAARNATATPRSSGDAPADRSMSRAIRSASAWGGARPSSTSPTTSRRRSPSPV